MQAPRSPELVLWHAPDCALSRDVKLLLEELPLPLTVVPYLEEPPSAETLRTLLPRLCEATGKSLRQLVREEAPAFAAEDLAKADDAQLLDAMARHPELLPRPLVFNGDAVTLADPMERAFDVLVPKAPEDAGAVLRSMLQGKPMV